MKMVTFLITIICFFGCQKDTLKLDREDFHVSYPVGYNLDESGQEGTTFVLTAQKDNDNDIFIENINLVTKNVGGVSFDELVKATEKEINGVGTVIENKRLKLNGKDCLRLVIEFTQNDIDFTYIQHQLVENGKAYALTFSCEKKMLDKYYEDMNSVLMSFTLK